jgi:hypothetical protein
MKNVEGTRGIEPPLCVSDKANGFEDRGAPSTIVPLNVMNSLKS